MSTFADNFVPPPEEDHMAIDLNRDRELRDPATKTYARYHYAFNLEPAVEGRCASCAHAAKLPNPKSGREEEDGAGAERQCLHLTIYVQDASRSACPHHKQKGAPNQGGEGLTEEELENAASYLSSLERRLWSDEFTRLMVTKFVVVGRRLLGDLGVLRARLAEAERERDLARRIQQQHYDFWQAATERADAAETRAERAEAEGRITVGVWGDVGRISVRSEEGGRTRERVYRVEGGALTLLDEGGFVPNPPPAGPSEPAPYGGLYVASRAAYAHTWRDMRRDGYHVVSSWIDEAGEGETDDRAELARRRLREAVEAQHFALYAEAGDELKGAYVELGARLQAGKEVWLVGRPDAFSRVFREHPLCAVTDLPSLLAMVELAGGRRKLAG